MHLSLIALLAKGRICCKLAHSMETFSHHGGQLLVTRAGQAASSRRLLLLHGWRQPASSLLPLVGTLLPDHSVIGLDTPGNGVAPAPPASWGIEDYVSAVAAFMAAQPNVPTVIVCHSFGCRLALRLAAQHLPWLQAIAVVGGHGLRPIRPLHKKIKVWGIVRITKILGVLDGLVGTALKSKWAGRFGSADYKAADSTMRAVFQRVIADDVAPLLPQVQAPVLLLYGARDTETPPAMGRMFNRLLPHSTYVELPNDDHYTVLTSAVVATRIKEFVQGLRL